MFSKKGSLIIKDYGNLKYDNINDLESPTFYKTMKNYGSFMSCNKALIDKIPQILQENQQFLCVGGDHAIGFGKFKNEITPKKEQKKKKDLLIKKIIKNFNTIIYRFCGRSFETYSEFVISLGRCSC